MQKIISLFKRDYEGTRRVYNEVVPGAEWVLNGGEGVATVKWDGTCCRITDRGSHSTIWKRYDAKHGKTPPAGFEPAQAPDPANGALAGLAGVPARQPRRSVAFRGIRCRLCAARGYV
jgi:hypothetical protein